MLALPVIFIALLSIAILAEQASHKELISNELSRKIPHLTTALAYASLPFIASFKVVAVAAIGHLLGALLAHKYHWFTQARAVNRKSFGEFFFPLGILGASLLTNSKWIFAAAVLTLGLADTFAALIGTKFGKHKFKIFGQTKSLEGSVTFSVVAAIIIAWAVWATPIGQPNSLIIIWLPLTAAGIEALSPFGMDNLFVPMIVAMALSVVSVAG